MVYEIVNPSDPYTIEGDDFAAVCLATLILGRGAYGLTAKTGETAMPIMLFDIDQEWFDTTFGKSFEELMEVTPRPAIRDALKSVLLCSVYERKAYSDALALVEDEEKRIALRDKWLEERRSSLNNIGARAYSLAERL